MYRYLSIILLLISSSAYATNNMKACFSVEGMTCKACTVTLGVAVKKLDGVASVKASVDKKYAVVEYDSIKTSADAISKKIDSVGYKSTKTECSKL